MFGGQAGDGSLTTGDLIAGVFKRMGLEVQAEDELSAINMVLGAAYAGVRAMTATSGPGQALMTEAIGLAGVLEIPVVVIECARTGPSTGMPTKTEQSNLNHLIYGGHGEIPRVVLAPGTSVNHSS